MTDTNTAPQAGTPQESPLVEPARVPANPALIEWPRDEWGFCTDLKAALTQAARNVRGNADKRDVFLSIVKIGVQHALSRYDGDKEALQAEIDRESDRIVSMNATNRVAGYTPLNTTEG